MRASDISIRLASAEDAEAIHRLLSELERALGATGSVKRSSGDILRHGFGKNPLFQALIASQAGEDVGLAVFFPEFSTWKGRPGVYVQDLYVAKAQRGTGLGRKLMQAVYEAAQAWDAAYCKLSVYGENEAALQFYRRLGFRRSKDEKVLIFDSLDQGLSTTLE
jgi:ribosomal protein S18 acetylase RimI-like enzyme